MTVIHVMGRAYDAPMSNHSLTMRRAPYKRRLFRRSSTMSPLKCLALFIFLFAAGAAGAVPVLAASLEMAAVTEQPMPYAATEGPTSAIALDINAGTMLRLPASANAVFVANPEIADVQLKSPKLMFVHARQPGETTIYAVDAKDNIILSHRVTVGHNLTRLGEVMRQVRPDSNIQVASLGDSIVLTGNVGSAQESDDLRGLATQLLGKNGQIINRLKISKPQQVNLRVRIAEVSRDITKQFNINLGLTQTIGNLALSGATGLFVNGGAAAGTQVIQGAFNSGDTSIDFLLDALDQNGLITLLAEPNLTAQNGSEANFLVGGEFPIPIRDSDGDLAIIFKQFGVSLGFIPIVLDDGQISIKILTEVSELSAAGAITIDSLTIPALSTRRAETTVNLGSGQSFAIAGLLQNTTNNALDRFPGLGELPILGSLFRSTDFQRSESELLVIVTPYLVRPVSNRIADPTERYQPSKESDRILMGDLNKTIPANVSTAAFDGQGRRGYTGNAGFILR
ncbi:type II and III secretion system protein family protein [Hwanghaeella grinnelliae]|uniref:Type II and III secretion system protein family protein n=1 Tax=Hwanghaeella grinnelliae TaxID=2500179 RepID=A0A437QL51_9PROT|nr:type II and III secretion system protein family protein [Hwanghaeella grinnelliae]RVU35192.1 type II and III secretion system protein family protein [Hwanghaeella grinnelliae]